LLIQKGRGRQEREGDRKRGEIVIGRKQEEKGGRKRKD
jgi:hypothetical protein